MANEVQTPRLRLVGSMYKGSPDETIPFLSEMFGRSDEIRHTGGITRQVQYASGTDADDYIHFMGFEVERIESIPEGMTAWDIIGNSWNIIQPVNGNDWLVHQHIINWKWLDTSVPGRPCGEFAVNSPISFGSDRPSLLRDFRIISNSYIGAPCNDDIFLVDYDKAWVEQYEQMKQRIQSLLGPDIALRIEHYGSTSIPGMPAKPVIDILVMIPSWEDGKKHAVPAFNSPEIEYWCSDHMRFYVRDKVTGVRTHHLHMAPAGHRIWEGIAFHDYLIAHPEDAARYLSLKYDLAERYPDDRLAYTNAKEAFVREITDKALRTQV
ncbi:MAG: GrpB family protein [Armatimonadota bacterium]